MGRATNEQCQEYGQRDRGGDKNYAIRQIRPAESEYGFEEHDMRREKQHGDEKCNVPGIAGVMLKFYFFLELMFGQRARDNCRESIAQSLFTTWLREVLSCSNQHRAGDSPQDTEHEDDQ